MSDIPNDVTPPTDAPASSSEKLSPKGMAAMQGGVDSAPVSDTNLPDAQFADRRGRDLTMRTFQVGDQFYTRTYDDQTTPTIPDTPTFGDAGRANLHLERDVNGNVTRARLQDIETTPTYREAGVGGKMLDRCEDLARKNGATEIYGSAPSDAATRQWYLDRAYRFRNNGLELFKII